MVEFVMGIVAGFILTTVSIFRLHLREIRRIKARHNDLTKRCIEAANQAIEGLANAAESALADRWVKDAYAAIEKLKPFMRR